MLKWAIPASARGEITAASTWRPQSCENVRNFKKFRSFSPFCDFCSKSHPKPIGILILFACWHFEENSWKFYENYFCAKIFRQIWTVAAGRITFAKCAFSFFTFHKKFMKSHQKSPTRKYAMNSYGFWVPREAEIAKIAKVQPRGYFLALFGKSHHILRL